uniref:Lines-like protein 1 n=1 Tax=Myotis myotis TaxID=51298 RepID=A0A7J7RS60_MYOMY|nr:lines-like protein 1 [Myotis myotis]
MTCWRLREHPWASTSSSPESMKLLKTWPKKKKHGTSTRTKTAITRTAFFYSF